MSVIIGAGIAGLYSAYQLHKRGEPYTILEKNAVGGRANTRSFYGTRVNIGAGVGREKDVLLRQLLRELDIPVQKVPTRISYMTPPPDMTRIWALLHKMFKKKHLQWTFKQFATECLGADYSAFVTATGFSDYEQASAYHTLHHYSMEDNFTSWTAFVIPWDELVRRLKAIVGPIRSAEVLAIEPVGDEYRVVTTRGVLQCQNIICATTIESVRRFFPHAIYRQIVGQPFLRMYGKFSKPIPLQGTTIVDTHLQKILPVDPKNGVYMIVYADNRHARALQKYTENTPANREYMCRLVERSLNIQGLHLTAILSFYWPEGTHYYKTPINIAEAQHPAPNIVVVGEMISLHQGWVEGALESVSVVSELDSPSKRY